MSATTAAQKARVLSEVGLSLSSSVSTLPSLPHWGRNQKNEKRNPRKLKNQKKKLSLWSTRRKSSARSSSTTTRTREYFRSRRERIDGERGREGEGKAEREAKRARRAEQQRGGGKRRPARTTAGARVYCSPSRVRTLSSSSSLSPPSPLHLSLSLSLSKSLDPKVFPAHQRKLLETVSSLAFAAGHEEKMASRLVRMSDPDKISFACRAYLAEAQARRQDTHPGLLVRERERGREGERERGGQRGSRSRKELSSERKRESNSPPSTPS